MFIAYGPAILFLSTFQTESQADIHQKTIQDAHSSTICNRQKLETTQLPIKKRTNG